MSILVDYRCPKCNQVLLGAKSDVEIEGSEPPKKADCGNCGTESVRAYEPDMKEYYYEVKS